MKVDLFRMWSTFVVTAYQSLGRLLFGHAPKPIALSRSIRSAMIHPQDCPHFRNHCSRVVDLFREVVGAHVCLRRPHPDSHGERMAEDILVDQLTIPPRQAAVSFFGPRQANTNSCHSSPNISRGSARSYFGPKVLKYQHLAPDLGKEQILRTDRHTGIVCRGKGKIVCWKNLTGSSKESIAEDSAIRDEPLFKSWEDFPPHGSASNTSEVGGGACWIFKRIKAGYATLFWTLGPLISRGQC